MTFWAYMLHCRGGKFYTGHTDDLERRMGEHRSGMVKGFTSDRLPAELVWSQDFPTRYEALTAERQIKGWSRAKKLALIRGDWDAVSRYAKSKNSAWRWATDHWLFPFASCRACPAFRHRPRLRSGRRARLGHHRRRGGALLAR